MSLIIGIPITLAVIALSPALLKSRGRTTGPAYLGGVYARAALLLFFWGLANFYWFMFALGISGGSAVRGTVENGSYYLAFQDHHTLVSKSKYVFMYWYEISTFLILVISVVGLLGLVVYHFMQQKTARDRHTN